MTRFRFVNGHVATPGGVLPGAEIVVDGDRIASIQPVEGSSDAIDLNGGWVVPGYIDTQVNGGGGVLFNDRLEVMDCCFILILVVNELQFGMLKHVDLLLA